MGNCQSGDTVHHVRVAEEQPSSSNSKSKKGKQQPSPNESTVPLKSDHRRPTPTWELTPGAVSPASTTATALSLTPQTTTVDGGGISPSAARLAVGPLPLHTRGDDEIDETDDHDSSNPAEDSTTTTTVHPRILYDMPDRLRTSPRRGRAYQARLEKARCLQLVLSNGNHNEMSTMNPMTVREDEELHMEYDESSLLSAHTGQSYASLTSKNSRTSSKVSSSSLHDEFEATVSQGTIWHQFDLAHATAVAWSRHAATLHHRHPELLLAAGTQDGRVLVHTVLPEANNTMQNHNHHSPHSYVPVTVDAPANPQQQNQQQRLSPPVEIVRSGRIRSLDFSRDGNYLAVGGDDGVVAIYQLLYENTEQNINNPPTSRGPLDPGEEAPSASVSNNGSNNSMNHNNIESPYDEKTWGRLVSVGLVVEIPRVDRVYAVQFRPDGAYLAIGGFDGNVAIVNCSGSNNNSNNNATTTPTNGGRWNYNNASSSESEPWEIVVEIPRDGLVYCLDWSPDSQYLAIGGSDKTCGLVHCPSSWKIGVELRRPAAIQSLRWHPNGRSLAIGAQTVAILDRDSWTIRHEVPISAASPTANNNNSNTAERNNRRTRRLRTKAHAMCWSPNGSYLLVSGQNGRTCSLLETKQYTVIHEIQRDATICDVSWGEQSVLGGIPARFICILTTNQVVILKAGLELRSTASSVGDDMSSNMSAASSYFSTRGGSGFHASGSGSNDWTEKNFRDAEVLMTTVHVSHPSTPEIVANGSGSITAAEDDGLLLPSQTTPSAPLTVRALCFSRGSKSRPSAFFAVATDDGFVTVRSTSGWQVVSKTEFVNPIRCLAFSNGSRYLALGGEDAKVYVLATVPKWSVAAEVTLSAPVTCLAFSKNNERLVAGALDGNLTFLDAVRDWSIVDQVVADESPVLSLDWSSRNLVVGRHDGAIAIYDSVQIFRGVLTRPFALTIDSPVRAVALGVSSRFLVVGGENGLIRVYSAKGGWEVCHELREGTSIGALRWSPTGRYVAYAGEEGLFKVLDTVFWSEIEEANDREVLPLPDSSKELCQLAFSQDGNMVACGPFVMDSRTWAPLLDLSQQLDAHSDDFSLSSREGGGLGDDVAVLPDGSAEF